MREAAFFPLSEKKIDTQCSLRIEIKEERKKETIETISKVGPILSGYAFMQSKHDILNKLNYFIFIAATYETKRDEGKAKIDVSTRAHGKSVFLC